MIKLNRIYILRCSSMDGHIWNKRMMLNNKCQFNCFYNIICDDFLINCYVHSDLQDFGYSKNWNVSLNNISETQLSFINFLKKQSWLD